MTPLRVLFSRLGALLHRRGAATPISTRRSRRTSPCSRTSRCDAACRRTDAAAAGESRIRRRRAHQRDLSRSAGTALPRNTAAGRALRAPRPSEEPCVRRDGDPHAGLGIGANTAIFSLIDALMLRSFPSSGRTSSSG